MSIINCTECHGNVSTMATSCPHCGVPFSNHSVTAASRSDATVKTTAAKSTPVNTPAALPTKEGFVKIHEGTNDKTANKNAFRKVISIACLTIGFAVMIYGYSQSPAYIAGTHPNSGVSWLVLVGGLVCAYGFNTWGDEK